MIQNLTFANHHICPSAKPPIPKLVNFGFRANHSFHLPHTFHRNLLVHTLRSSYSLAPQMQYLCSRMHLNWLQLLHVFL